MADDRRGPGRHAATSFRMSDEDYAQLKREVDETGLRSLQELLEIRVFGEIRPRQKTGPKPKARQEERLDISA